MTNKEIAMWLKQFHNRILETDLCSKIYEQEMEAIIEATTLAENAPIKENKKWIGLKQLAIAPAATKK